MGRTEIIKSIFNKTTSSKAIHDAILLVEDISGDFSLDLGYGGKTIDTPVFTASVGKLFTTTCVLILKEQGKLALDDPLSKYFDSSILDRLHVSNDIDYSNQLTISNLLFQTSGLPDWLGNGRDKEIFLNDDKFLSFEEKISTIKKDKRHFVPSSRSGYSDTNFSILGKIIENITEMSLAEVCHEWIFKPLGLTKTYLPTSAEDFVTKVFYKDELLYRPNAMRAASGSGDAMTTTRELMIFIKAFFGGKLFPEANFERLAKYGKLGFLVMGGAWYGGGYVRIPLGVPEKLFMGKGELLGHSGATGAFAFYHTESELYFVGDCNQLARPDIPIALVVKLAMKLK